MSLVEQSPCPRSVPKLRDRFATMTPRRKKVSDATEQPSGNLRRVSTWAGLRSGDPVEVTDTRLRSAKWEFVAHVRNIVTGAEWIEVVGGRPGDRNLRLV